MISSINRGARKTASAFLALVLACLVMCFGTSTAFALNTPDLTRTDCSLTLTLKTTDGKVAPGIKLGITRVGEAEVTNTGYAYKLTNEYADTGVDLSTLGDDAETDLKNAATFVSYADEKGYTYKDATTDDKGVASFKDLACGLYAVTVLEAPEGYQLGSPFMVTLPQGSFDDGWAYDVKADAKPIKLTYTPPSKPHAVDLPVTKRVTGDTPPTDGTFTFVLKADKSSYPMPKGSSDGIRTITVKGTGTFEFGDIEYTEPGTYTYSISERKRSETGYTYDSSVYDIKCTVTKGDGGGLTAATAISKNGSAVSSATFVNKYTKSTKPAALPQTGQFWQPVLLLVTAGLVLLLTGLWRSRRDDLRQMRR